MEDQIMNVEGQVVKNTRSLRWTLLGSALLSLFFAQQAVALPQAGGKLHTPPKGSAERKAILDVLREEYRQGQGIQVQFLVNHLKVKDGWAWANVTPLDGDGKPVGEGWPSLLHYEEGKWVTKDLITVAETLDDPVGPMDPSPEYIKGVQKKYPGVPAEIIPKRGK
jgi:hypothetical protein